MKYLTILCLVLFFAAAVFATEARVESMGSNADFIKDDVSIFDNPATAFDFGNLLVGSMGKVSKIDSKWQRTDEWGGGCIVYPLNDQYKLALGGTLNRTSSLFTQYQDLEKRNYFTVLGSRIDSTGKLVRRYGTESNLNKFVDYLEAVDVSDLKGNVYVFTGLSMSNGFNVGIGGRYAGTQRDVGADNSTSLSIAGGNLGVTYKFDENQLEAGINYNSFSVTKKAPLPKLGLSVEGEKSYNVFMRAFYHLNTQSTLVPTLYLDKTNMLGINNTDLGIGAGFNRDLHKGFIWAGMKYAYHTAKYPETIDNYRIYSSAGSDSSSSSLPPGIEEKSHKLLFSFGVEKQMLWDWFKIRVGGNKVFEYLTKNKSGQADYTVEKGLFERNVDVVSWGIALGTPDERLMFDVTFSEEFPYSNILAGGEDGIMVSRIDAALKF